MKHDELTWLPDELQKSIRRTIDLTKPGSLERQFVTAMAEMMCERHLEQRQQIAGLSSRCSDLNLELNKTKAKLEDAMLKLTGGFDRRGLDCDPRGLIVQHGIHTVIEDSR